MDDIKSLNTATAAIALYLYRQANSPYGETVQGLMIWIDKQRSILADFLEDKNENLNP